MAPERSRGQALPGVRVLFPLQEAERLQILLAPPARFTPSLLQVAWCSFATPHFLFTHFRFFFFLLFLYSGLFLFSSGLFPFFSFADPRRLRRFKLLGVCFDQLTAALCSKCLLLASPLLLELHALVWGLLPRKALAIPPPFFSPLPHELVSCLYGVPVCGVVLQTVAFPLLVRFPSLLSLGSCSLVAFGLEAEAGLFEPAAAQALAPPAQPGAPSHSVASSAPVLVLGPASAGSTKSRQKFRLSTHNNHNFPSARGAGA